MKRAVFFILFALMLFAEVPAEFVYQGKLTDADGLGITDNLPMTFRLYNDVIGGTALWEETHTTVQIEKGLFSVLLGGTTPVEGDLSGDIYLEIEIDGDVMSPRVKIAPSLTAIHAGVADSIAGFRPSADDLSDNNLDDLSDVTIVDVEADDVVMWDGTEWVNGVIPVTDDITDDNLEDLFDVQITSATTGQLLSWDGTRWINSDPVTADEAYNSDFAFNDGTNELSITDGDGTLAVTIDNEADRLSDNVISDLMDVNTAGALPGRILVYNGTDWVPGDPSSATDNQTDIEVPLTSPGDFTFIDGESNVHGGLNDLDDAIGALDDGNPATTMVTWYDISTIPPGFADGVDDADHVTNLTFSDAADQLILTDGGGTLIANIENEADDLTDNSVSDIGDVTVSSAENGDILQYMGGDWVNQSQSDQYVLLSDTTIFSHISGETDLMGALNDVDSTLQWLLDDPDLVNDGDTLVGNEYITDFTWSEVANRLTVTDGGGANELFITGFSEDDHTHELLTAGDGLVGGTYDGATPEEWDVLPGHGLAIYMDSLVLDPSYTSGAIYDDIYVSHFDSAGGDIRGTFDSLKVTKIQGRPVSDDAPGFGSLLAWDGTEWGLTTATLTWADSGSFIRPTTDSTCVIRIYDKGDTSALKIEEIDGDRTGIWRGISVERKGNIESKGYGVYGEAGAVSDLGAAASISEFYGLFGKAVYGRMNYGVYGYAPSAPTDCEAYGVYGEGQTGGGWFYGPDNDGEVAALKIQNSSYTMLIDGNEIDVNDELYLLKNSDSSCVSVGYVDGAPDTRLHVMGGLAIGKKQSTRDDIGFLNSIQLATSTIGDDPVDPTYDNHTGALMYTDLDGTWGEGSFNLHIGTHWGVDDTLPAIKIGRDKLTINPPEIDLMGDATLTAYGTLHIVPGNDGILDQQYIGSGSVGASGPGGSRWQSFTPAVSGYLIKLGLYLWDSTCEFTIRIREGEGTSGTILASQVITYDSDAWSWDYFTFGAPARLDAETVYTIELYNSGSTGTFAWGCGTNTYSRGTSANPSTDYTFKTYMSERTGTDFVVKENGNVGIGTSNPVAALDVNGDVLINGSISKSSGSFLIDHPDDPYNKTLRHNFVESPEDLCMYRGKVELDEDGMGIVEMPSYFKGLTKEDEASANLTPVGRPFPTGCEWNEDFTELIVYGDPGRSVFWTVYADRDDPYIRWARPRMPIEEDKKTSVYCDEGLLLSPQAYGLLKEDGYMYKKHHIDPPVQEQE